jgi:uncharacterized membrane protein YdjX (TVP38/TMEM64 family)
MGPRAVLRALGQVGPLAAAAAFLPPIGALVLLATINRSAAWLRAHDELGVAVFVAGFAVCGGLALLPTYTPSLIGGWAFGVGPGLGATLAGFLGAAAIGFALARRLSGDRLMSVLHEYPRGLAIHDALLGTGFWRALLVVALVRLPPNSPFALANLLLGGSRVPIGPFLLGTLVGLTPRATAAVIVGAGLSSVDVTQPARSGVTLAWLALTVAAVGAVGWMANRALRRLGPTGSG